MLQAKHFRVIGCLLTSENVPQAAKASGISERTLRRWLRIPAFQDALRETETEVLQTACRRMGLLACRALQTLERILADDGASEGARVRAAAAVLDHALRWRCQVVLEDRVRALEALNGRNHNVHREPH